MTLEIRRRAAWGMVAGLLSAFAVKGVTLGGQVIAARFLTPADYGEVAPALSLGSLAGMCAVSSWAVMILRAPADRRLQSSVFVAGVALALIPLLGVASAVLLPWAPLSPRGAMLALLVVAPVLFSPFTTLYSANLQMNLRFSRIATLQFVEGATSTVALVVLAFTGTGAFAVAASKSVGAAVAVALYRGSANPLQLVRVSVRDVVGVIRRGILLSVYLAAANLVATLPSAVVALRHDVEVAGVIAWSLQFALQLPVVLAFAARQVQISVASNQRLHGHTHDWLTDASPLVTAGAMLAMLQATTAPILIPLVFPDRWHTAIVAVQVLSLGQILLPLVTVQAGNALIEGRLWQVLLSTVAGLACVAAAAWWATRGAHLSGDTVAVIISLGFALGYAANWSILAACESRLDRARVLSVAGGTLLAAGLLTAFRATQDAGLASHIWVVALWAALAIACVRAAWVWHGLLRPA